jgi:hypothetical protein
MIIGLSGHKGSGKDLVAAYLVKEHGFERKAFADPLKRSVAALFNIPFSDVDKLKMNDKILVGIGMIGEPEYDQWIQHMGYQALSWRELLQRYGTEAHRDVFGVDFWLEYTLPLGGYYPGRAIVVSDVRFENEANRIKELGGFVWFIDRPSVFPGHDLHTSEVFDFDEDWVVINDGTIEELYEEVEKALMGSVTESGDD